jgi:3-phenylpropionate/trans-cinnamate dioxygenase ferredoxin reductase subunit
MPQEQYKYVLVGGGLASAQAVQGVREVDSQGSILLVCAEKRLPYHRPPLTKGLLLGKKKPEDVFCKPQDFYEKNLVQILQGTRATGIDPQARRLNLENGTEVLFDRLLLATGSRARRLSIPGADLPWVMTIRTLDDSLDLLSGLAQVRTAVIVGGSFLGAETASALAQKGIETTMLFPEFRILERLLDAELGGHLHHLFESKGVRILTGRKPAAFLGKDRIEAVRTDRDERIPADLVVLGVGADLNNELAKEAGLALGRSGGVRVDSRLRTSSEAIYAAGDIAEYPDPTYQKPLRLEHWDSAFRQGLTAGRNMAGADEPFTALPHYFSTLFDLGFSVWGDFSNWETTIRAGEIGRTGSWVLYLAGGRLSGILAFDPVDPDQEHEIEALVRARPDRETLLENLRKRGLRPL